MKYIQFSSVARDRASENRLDSVHHTAPQLVDAVVPFHSSKEYHGSAGGILLTKKAASRIFGKRLLTTLSTIGCAFSCFRDDAGLRGFLTVWHSKNADAVTADG